MLVSMKVAGPVDRAVDMAFGGQMHHRIGLVGGKDPVERGAVADVGLLEGVVRARPPRMATLSRQAA